jgi:hypothetical protein
VHQKLKRSSNAMGMLTNVKEEIEKVWSPLPKKNPINGAINVSVLAM